MVNRYEFLLILILTFFAFSISLIQEEEESPIEEQANVNPPRFSRVSGFYPVDFKLKLISEEGTKIYYTLDSSDPRTSESSKEFKDYILIYDRSSEPNVYSAYEEDEESPVSVSKNQRYKAPLYPVDKAMIVRAVAKNDEGQFSEIITKIYFVTNYDLIKYQDLNLVSLVTEPDNLFSPEIGIYVTGNSYQEWKKSENYTANIRAWDPQTQCNFVKKGKEWEREAVMTFIEKGEITLQQNVGIRVKGAATRSYASKSFNVYASEQYGKSKIKTDLLKRNYDINGKKINSYETLAIRSVYDDSRIRDILGRDIYYVRQDLTSSEMEPVVLFVNGEYWGFYLVQENFKKDFIHEHYLIPKKDVALAKIKEMEEGPEDEITKLFDFCEEYAQKDVTNDKIYKEITNYIDEDSLIELYASEIYIGNSDWPGNNDGEWRNLGEKIEGNKYSDGKWRFIIFDIDYSMGGSWGRNGNNNIFMNVQRRASRTTVAQLFLNLLMNNTNFRNKFVNIFCDYANQVFNISRVGKILEKYRDFFGELVPYSQLRWQGGRNNIRSVLEGIANYKTNYLKRIDALYNFYESRPIVALQNMKDFMELKGDIVDLTVKIEGIGKVQINSIIIELTNGGWTGKYISRIPISIKAIPGERYSFKEWKGLNSQISQSDEIILFGNETIIACFE